MSGIYFKIHSKIRLVMDGKMLDGERMLMGEFRWAFIVKFYFSVCMRFFYDKMLGETKCPNEVSSEKYWIIVKIYQF